MYAVIFSGGKQYRVQKGDTIKLEMMPVDIGAKVDFDKIMLVGEGENVKLGNPYLDGCSVSAEVLTQSRHKKVEIIKFRRRKHHEKWQGHRQYFTEVRITDINA